jgi:serine/threonine-protein kinase
VLLGFVVVWLLLPKGEQAQVVATPAPPVPAPAPMVVAPKAPEPPPAPEKKMVRFHVSTEPAGAHVFIGRHDMGSTPTMFELPSGSDGMANAEMVLVLDGYPTQAITSGGSGDVVVNAKLQKKVVMRVEKPIPLTKREEEREREEGKASTLPVRPEPAAVAAVARGTTTQPQAQPASVGTTATKPLAAPTAPVAEAPRDVVPFGEGMTRPVLMQPGRPITYTREAIAARVEGVSIVRCVITSRGRGGAVQGHQATALHGRGGARAPAVAALPAGQLPGEAGLGRVQLLGPPDAAPVRRPGASSRGASRQRRVRPASPPGRAGGAQISALIPVICSA